MARSGDRLPRLIKRAHELPRLCRLLEQVGIDEASGSQQPVVVGGVRFCDRSVYVNAARRLVQVDAANVAVA